MAQVAATYGWFYWRISEGEADGDSAPAVSRKARGLAHSQAHSRHIGMEDISALSFNVAEVGKHRFANSSSCTSILPGGLASGTRNQIGGFDRTGILSNAKRLYVSQK